MDKLEPNGGSCWKKKKQVTTNRQHRSYCPCGIIQVSRRPCIKTWMTRWERFWLTLDYGTWRRHHTSNIGTLVVYVLVLLSFHWLDFPPISLGRAQTVPGASTDIPVSRKLVKFQFWANLIYLSSQLLRLGEWKVQGPPSNPSPPLSSECPERIGPERAFIVHPLSISGWWTISQCTLCGGFL